LSLDTFPIIKMEEKPSVLVWITADEDLVDETRELCSSAGYDIISEVRQTRSSPEKRSYLGPGKLEEVAGIEGVEYLITPSDLDPSQVFRMGKVTGLKVVDRIRLVLDLFRSKASMNSTNFLVLISSKPKSLRTQTFPSLFLRLKAERSAPFRTFLGMAKSYVLGLGPNTTPPPRQMGERIVPALARPVPFCRHGLAPPPRTMDRVLVDADPFRFRAICIRTTSWMR
jgi:hypothetical protein